MKKKTSFSLSGDVLKLLASKAKKLGLSKTAAVQLAIRKLDV